MLRLLVLVTDQPLTGWLWRVTMVLTTIMCVFFTGVFGHASWAAATQENDRRSATIFAALTLLFLVAPFAALYLKGRTEEILCPKHVMVHGRPALHFPGDRRGMKLSTMMYPVLAAVCIAFGLPSNGGELRPSAVIVWALAALFLSYPLFAVAGRFVEDGTFITEQGVAIRARGLRAELPWTSIAGSTTYRERPFLYERIAIHLYPGSPREVTTTVPWWIGSPRPRGDTVFLTKVQVPGFFRREFATNPGNWIADFADDPPTSQQLEKSDVTPSQTRRAEFVSSLRNRAEHREAPPSSD